MAQAIWHWVALPVPKNNGECTRSFLQHFHQGSARDSKFGHFGIKYISIYIYIYILLVFYYIPIVSRFFALKLQSSSAIQHVTNASESQHMFVLLLLQVLVSPRGSDRKNLAWSMWVGLCKGTSYRKPTH